MLNTVESPNSNATNVASVLGYFVVLSGAHFFSVSGNPTIGMLIFSVSLLLLMMNAAVYASDHPMYRLLAGLACVPILRLLNLGLPLLGLPLVVGYLATALPMLAPLLLIFDSTAYTLEDIGLTWRGLPLQILIGLVGIPVGYLLFRQAALGYVAGTLSMASFILPSLILIATTGLFEEVLFRGLLQRAATESIGMWPAILFIASLYTVLSAMTGSASLSILVVFMTNLFFSWAAAKTSNIWGTIIAHGLVNVMLLIVMPIWRPLFNL